MFTENIPCQTSLQAHQISVHWLFSKWQPSTILNFPNFPFTSYNLLPCTKVCHNRPVNTKLMAIKTIFNIEFIHHLEFSKFECSVIHSKTLLRLTKFHHKKLSYCWNSSHYELHVRSVIVVDRLNPTTTLYRLTPTTTLYRLTLTTTLYKSKILWNKSTQANMKWHSLLTVERKEDELDWSTNKEHPRTFQPLMIHLIPVLWHYIYYALHN